MIYSLFLVKASETATNGVKQYSMAGQLFYLLFILVLMLTMIYFAAKFVQKTKFGSNYNKDIRIIDRVAIGANTYLAVVYCYERYFLISVNKEQTSLIAELDADAIKKEEQKSSETEPLSFSNYFKEIVKSDKFNSNNRNKAKNKKIDNIKINDKYESNKKEDNINNNSNSKENNWSKKLIKDDVDLSTKNLETISGQPLKNETLKDEQQNDLEQLSNSEPQDFSTFLEKEKQKKQ